MRSSTTVMDRYLTAYEEKRLLSIVGSLVDVLARRDYAWIRTLLYSGMRIKEFSLLTISDVEDALRFGTLFIPKEHRKGYKKGRAKDHVIRMNVLLRKALSDLLAIRKEMGADFVLDAPLVISRKGGGAMSVRSYQARFKEWASKAGLSDRASPHWLRHTCAMRIKERTTRTDPLLAIKAQLGHSSLASTGVYVKVTKEEIDDALAETFGHESPPSRKERRKRWQEFNRVQEVHHGR